MAFFGGRWRAAVSIVVLRSFRGRRAEANPALVVDVDSGAVLYEFDGHRTLVPGVAHQAHDRLCCAQRGARRPHHNGHAADGVGPGRQHGTLEDGVQAGHAGDARQCSQDADGKVAQRHRCHDRGGCRRLCRRLCRSDEQLCGPFGLARIALRQSERPTRSEPLQLGTRHGDDRARSAARVSGGARSLRHRRPRLRRSDHPQPQQPSRTLSRPRRHENRLYLFGRLQCGAQRPAQWPPPGGGGARRAFGCDPQSTCRVFVRSLLRRRRKRRRPTREPAAAARRLRRPTFAAPSAAEARANAINEAEAEIDTTAPAQCRGVVHSPSSRRRMRRSNEPAPRPQRPAPT